MSTSPKSPTKHLTTAASVSPTTKSNTKLNNLINLPPTTNSDSEMHNEKQQQQQNCKRIKLSDSVDDLSNSTNGIEQQEDQKILVHKTPKVKK
jgi:hypothetical protein